jgi:hypothetical protein
MIRSATLEKIIADFDGLWLIGLFFNGIEDDLIALAVYAYCHGVYFTVDIGYEKRSHSPAVNF